MWPLRQAHSPIYGQKSQEIDSLALGPKHSAHSQEKARLFHSVSCLGCAQGYHYLWCLAKSE